MSHDFSRRSFLHASQVLLASTFSSHSHVLWAKDAHEVAAPEHLHRSLIRIEKTTMYNRFAPALVAVPKGVNPGEKLPLAILLPGGEHTMQKREHGVWGWWSDFQLGELDRKLRQNQLSLRDTHSYLKVTDLHVMNEQLHTQPYKGMVLVTPWILRRQTQLDPHGKMIVPFLRLLVERIQSEFPVRVNREQTALAGVSAGGSWALYLGAHCSDLFAHIVALQPVTSIYAKQLVKLLQARKHGQSVHLIASQGDTLRKQNREFADMLKAKAIGVHYEEILGPHKPDVVAGAGGLRLLYLLDRAFQRTTDSPLQASSATVSSSATTPASSQSQPMFSAMNDEIGGAALGVQQSSQRGLVPMAAGVLAGTGFVGALAWRLRKLVKQSPRTL